MWIFKWGEPFLWLEPLFPVLTQSCKSWGHLTPVPTLPLISSVVSGQALSLLVLASSSIQWGGGGGAEIHWISSPYKPEIFLDGEWADSFYLWHCPFLPTPYNVCNFKHIVGLNEKMHVKLEQCLMQNKLQLNVRSSIFLLCWKYVSPPPIVQNHKLIPGLVLGTGSVPDAD